MANDDPVDLNYIALDMKEQPTRINPKSPLEIELKQTNREVGCPMLSASSNVSSADGSEIKTPTAAPVVPKLPIVHMWYFSTTSTTRDLENKNNYVNERKFVCCGDSQLPVKVDLSMRFTSWTFPTKNLEGGLYDVIIGLTTTTMKFDLIESLTFRIATVGGKSISPSERIWKEDLKAMCGTTHKRVKWKLCLQLEHTKEHDTLMMVMDIRPSYAASSAVDNGRIDMGHLDLCFMELHASENADVDQDPSTLSHRPWMWSLDVHHGSEIAASKTIIHYDFSGDKSHVATLSVSESNMILELWDISGTEDASEAARTDSNIDTRSKHPSQQPALCGMVKVALTTTQGLDDLRKSFCVSTSWDGSQVALIDARRRDKEEANLSSIYRHEHSRRLLAHDSTQPSRFVNNCNPRVPLRGKFHVIKTSDQGAQDEIFIACTEEVADIYDLSQNEKNRRSLHTLQNYHGSCRDYSGDGLMYHSFFHERHLTSDGCYPTTFRRPTVYCSGKYFVWVRADFVSVWDMEQGVPTSLKLLEYANAGCASYSISDDKTTLAVLSGNLISVNEIASGTEIQSTQLQGHSFTEVRFIRNDTQLLVQTSNSQSEYNGELYGLILDTSGLFIVAQILMPGYYIDVVKSPGADDQFYAAHGSRLHRLHLQECILKPYSQPYILSCNETCKDNLTHLDALPTEYRARNGLQFTATWEQDIRCTAVLTMTDANDSNPKTLSIPFAKHSCGGRVAVFLDKLHRLLIADGDIIMVWALPETIDDDLTLLFLGYRRGVWGICRHQQLLCPDLFSEVDYSAGVLQHLRLELSRAILFPAAVLQCLPVEHPDSINSSMHFLAGFGHLFNLELTDKSTKERIEQYIGRHINRKWSSDYGKVDLFCHLRGDKGKVRWGPVDAAQEDLFQRFLAFVFQSSSIRWNPTSDMDHASNPIFFLLRMARSKPEALKDAKAIVDYCFQQATTKKDMRLLRPVMQTLHSLIDPTRPYFNLTVDILQRLARFPVKNRQFLIQNHIIINPKLRYWKSGSRELYQCKDPILQMKHPLRKSNPRHYDKYFTRELFAASFDLLWIVNIRHPWKLSLEWHWSWDYLLLWIRYLPSWIMAARHKLRLILTGPVETYDFQLDMLDSPAVAAIAALIEYKWNTIGFKYWLARFFSQCCFYALVLTAVYKHIYENHERSPEGLFIALLVSSSFFLLLEVVQMIKNWKRYRSSSYNIVDLAVFGLPFFGSINQLKIISGKIEGSTANEGNAGIFSFAVIFIFLHILFELRVNRTVCHFVTIITGIIGQIRIFFVIFIAGIFAFTIATLHILHACPFEECSEPTTKLPPNFFYALSSTYFLMGGRYDAVSEDFDSDNWQFHLMMMIYFFFTVVLMLNVLIALINMAFSDSEAKWQRVWLVNRLQVIEGAENLSYLIPGFRQSSPWFPNEIYYTTATTDLRDFTAACSTDDGHDLFSVGDPLTVLQTQQKTVQKEIVDMQDQSRKRYEQLQGQGAKLEDQIVALTNQNKELKDQLRQQQESLEAQINGLKDFMRDLVPSRPS
ncbi:hypothetical protein BGZ72_009193 [Mortierella alpina]|nr:hypothetical protein BGZ72_009193 [Mortierella alpina]